MPSPLFRIPEESCHPRGILIYFQIIYGENASPFESFTTPWRLVEIVAAALSMRHLSTSHKQSQNIELHQMPAHIRCMDRIVLGVFIIVGLDRNLPSVAAS